MTNLRPASEKQTTLIIRLAGEKDTSSFGNDTLADLNDVLAGREIASRHASDLIDCLFAARRAGSAPTVEPGFYAVGDDVYRVRPGKRYAEVLVPGVKGSWAYAKGAIYRLAGVTPLTKDEAAEMGRRMGFCVRCGAYLEADGPWRATGMGPVCWKKDW